jgi:hypothetical protein
MDEKLPGLLRKIAKRFGRQCYSLLRIKNILNFSKGKDLKRIITIFVITAILLSVTGCGPGRPFEIESLRTPQSVTAIHPADARSFISVANAQSKGTIFVAY